MAVINATDCFDGLSIYGVNFTGNSVNLGEIWFAQVPPLFKGSNACVEIINTTDEPSSSYLLQTQHATCYDCYNNNYGIYTFTSCSGKETIYFSISAFSSTFFSTFVPRSVYFIDALLDGKPFKGCFQANLSLTTEEAYNKLQSLNLISNTVTVTGFTSCEDCATNSPLIYAVERCIDGSIDIVQLPSNLTNQLISYTDGTNEFCGTVRGTTSSPSPQYTFVSTFGEKVECDVCLDVENNKFIIENCTNSAVQEVVWGSQLFQNGSVSNLQFGGGCYEVISATTSAVTLNLFLDFEPQPTCPDCLECHGVFYEYALCSDPLVKVGEILSYQIISASTVFYHPTLDQFVVRLDALTAATTLYDTFYSLITKSDCSDPNPTYSVWEAEICGLGKTTYITTTNNTFTTGDTVQTLWGSNNFLCATLIQDVTGVVSGNTYLHSNTKFNSCQDCQNTTIGIRTLDCFTSVSEVVDLPYTAWTETTNYGGFNGSYTDCFLDSNGLCRTIVDVCPLEPTGNTLSVSQQYINCNICTIFNPRPLPPKPDPVSAGTEYFACQICCPCDSGGTVTSVAVPHPVWTGTYGNAVTLLDSVQLGGMNGLNN